MWKASRGGPWLSYIINSQPHSIFCTPNLDFCTQQTNKHFELSHSNAVKNSLRLYCMPNKCQEGPSQWPHGLRCGCGAGCLLGLQVQICLFCVLLLIACEFCWPILIQPLELWRISAHVMAGTLTTTLGWMNEWMYHNFCYNCFVAHKLEFLCTVTQWKRNPHYIKYIAQLLYTFSGVNFVWKPVTACTVIMIHGDRKDCSVYTTWGLDKWM
jgi:hypothetical protein